MISFSLFSYIESVQVMCFSFLARASLATTFKPDLILQAEQALGVAAQYHLYGFGAQACLCNIVNDAPLAQESIIAGKKYALCTNQVRYYRKNSVPVEIRGRSSIIPHLGGNALYLRH